MDGELKDVILVFLIRYEKMKMKNYDAEGCQKIENKRMPLLTLADLATGFYTSGRMKLLESLPLHQSRILVERVRLLLRRRKEIEKNCSSGAEICRLRIKTAEKISELFRELTLSKKEKMD